MLPHSPPETSMPRPTPVIETTFHFMAAPRCPVKSQLIQSEPITLLMINDISCPRVQSCAITRHEIRYTRSGSYLGVLLAFATLTTTPRKRTEKRQDMALYLYPDSSRSSFFTVAACKKIVSSYLDIHSAFMRRELDDCSEFFSCR